MEFKLKKTCQAYTYLLYSFIFLKIKIIIKLKKLLKYTILTIKYSSYPHSINYYTQRDAKK